MKPLTLDSAMTNMGGVFYPTGHVFALFPDEDCVRQAASALDAAGLGSDAAYASPATILEDIVRTLGTADAPLPSVGAEGDIVRRIADLASHGHHGLLLKLQDHGQAEALAATLAREGTAAAFHYRTFVIEDLVTQPLGGGGTPSVTVGTHAVA